MLKNCQKLDIKKKKLPKIVILKKIDKNFIVFNKIAIDDFFEKKKMTINKLLYTLYIPLFSI